jgi:hypothetical protein
MNRLPQLPQTTDKGIIYVVQRGEAYKIGFTRASLGRRTRDAGGVLVLTIPTGQRPSQLEYLINNRFSDKRLPDIHGSKREWFALTPADLDWLRGLADHLS